MSIYDEITQAIIAELEKGVPPIGLRVFNCRSLHIGSCALVYKTDYQEYLEEI